VLPRFDVRKRHALNVAAPAGRVWEALLRHRFGTSGPGRILMALRGYGWRATDPGDARDFFEGVERLGFVRVEQVPGRELVFGLVGRFWKARGELRRVSREEFLAFGEEGFAKAAWNVAIEPAAGSGTLLSTETRVLAFGASARRKFRLYWSLIEAFSGLTRIGMLRDIRAEALRALRGGGA
jgi:hypothetical protein